MDRRPDRLRRVAAMIAWALVLVAGCLTAASGLVIVIAVRAVHHLLLGRAAQERALQEALLRATAAEAAEQQLRQALEDEHTRRVADLQALRAHLEELRERYERAIREHRLAHAIDGPSLSRRVQ